MHHVACSGRHVVYSLVVGRAAALLHHGQSWQNPPPATAGSLQPKLPVIHERLGVQHPCQTRLLVNALPVIHERLGVQRLNAFDAPTGRREAVEGRLGRVD